MGDARYIVMRSEPYEGLSCPGELGYEEDEPLPTFATRDEARAWARDHGLISPKGKRNNSEILVVEAPFCRPEGGGP